MKKTLLFSLCSISLAVSAQTNILNFDFENFDTATNICLQDSNWTTWSNAPGGAEDAFVSTDQASSGTKSLKLESPTGQGPTDLVLKFGQDYSSGRYEVDLNIYVADANGGYFNIQTSETPGVNWAMEAYFDTSGAGYLNAGGQGVGAFNYTQDAWHSVKVIADLDIDTGYFILDGTEIHSWVWSATAQGTGMAKFIGGMNIYAAAPNNTPTLYYIDDLSFGIAAPPVGINQLGNQNTLLAYPNPVSQNGILHVSGIKGNSIHVLDLCGRIVKTYSLQSTSLDINTSKFQSGMYILRNVSNGSDAMLKFVVK